MAGLHAALPELFKDAFLLFQWDADAGVLDFNQESSLVTQAGADSHAASFRRELDRVGQQVAEDLLQLADILKHHRHTRFDEGGDAVSGPVKTSSITMRLRVPTARFDGLLRRLDTLGVVTSRNIGAQDVTSEVVDVDSRVNSAKASIARMQVLYEKAQSIADVAAIEGELSRREADLESLLARQKQLGDQTSLATIGVTLFDDSVPQPAGPKTGVAKAFDDALETFGNALRNILVAVAAVLPFLVLGLLLGLPTYRILRRRSARRARPEPAAGTASAATVVASTSTDAS